MMFNEEEIDYLISLLDDDETSPLVDSILDKLENNIVNNIKLSEAKWNQQSFKFAYKLRMTKS